jgi:AcrR family transcriptional regulator
MSRKSSSKLAMYEPRIDRRIQKTRKLLSQALLDLILEKGYERVTVQDILDRANVGRSTFYTHYENKELLLRDGPRNLGFSLFGGSDKAAAQLEPDGRQMGFRGLFQHVSQNLPLAKAMVGKHSGSIMLDSFHSQISRSIGDYYRSHFSDGKKDKLLLSYLSEAAASAVCSLLTFWVDHDLSLSVDEISIHCQRIVKAILH